MNSTECTPVYLNLKHLFPASGKACSLYDPWNNYMRTDTLSSTWYWQKQQNCTGSWYPFSIAGFIHTTKLGSDINFAIQLWRLVVKVTQCHATKPFKSSLAEGHLKSRPYKQKAICQLCCIPCRAYISPKWLLLYSWMFLKQFVPIFYSETLQACLLVCFM